MRPHKYEPATIAGATFNKTDYLSCTTQNHKGQKSKRKMKSDLCDVSINSSKSTWFPSDQKINKQQKN